ncbi:uncharacterized protein METZ01_LOCUS419173, partial [marine metagenome]
VRGVPLAGEALRVIESVRRQLVRESVAKPDSDRPQPRGQRS